VQLYDETPSLQDRTCTTGIVDRTLVARWAAGGYVGRAAGRNFDSRRDLAYPPYEAVDLPIPVLDSSDVDARVWVRIREVEQSLDLIDQIVRRLPTGATRVEINTPGEVREGLGMAEAFRGDVLVWVRLEDGRLARCHLRDPSWFQWPLLEAVIEGNIVADFPLCNKSFNCSYSGHDL
jgi:Ni,Fe-hydrogenase III large subunit